MATKSVSLGKIFQTYSFSLEFLKSMKAVLISGSPSRRSWIISVVEVRLREAKGQKFFLVEIWISSGPRKALFGVETKHFGKIPCVFMDRILDKLNWLLNFHFDLRLFFNFGLHLRLNFRLFLLLLFLFAGIEVVGPLICLFFPLLLDDLTFFSELLLTFAIEESLHDIDSLMENLIQRG